MRAYQLRVAAHGSDTHFASGGPAPTVVWVEPPDAGVSASLVMVTSPTEAALDITIAADAAPGQVQVVLATDLEEALGAFEVVPLPEITLDPAGGYQREAVTVQVTGSHTHFSASDTQVEVTPGYGVSVQGWQVQGAESLTVDLLVAADAQVGAPVELAVTDAWQLTARAPFGVWPGRRAVELVPGGVEQGKAGVEVEATGYYLDWGAEADLSVEVEPGCAPFLSVHEVHVAEPGPWPGAPVGAGGLVTFQADVAVLAPLGTCTLTFHYAPGGPGTEDTVSAALEILPGFVDVTVGSETAGYLEPGEQDLFRVDLAAGEVIRARVSRDPYTFIDPVLEVFDASLVPGATPLATNDDESGATVNPRVVYRAPAAGQYFLLVRDRLGFNAGGYVLSLAEHAPEQAPEPAPPGGTGEPSHDDLASAWPVPAGALLVRGSFDGAAAGPGPETTPDALDYLDLRGLTLPPGGRVLVQVIALGVSPYAGSGADVLLRALDPSGAEVASATDAWWSPDPALYIDAASLAYLVLEREGPAPWAEGPGAPTDPADWFGTAYWVNVRPQVVVSEVLHDEATGWQGSFVELQGEVGADLGALGCHLLGLGADASGPLGAPLFDIDLAGRVIGPSGYHVVGHDDLVPGVSTGEAEPAMAIADPGASLTTIAVVLQCGGEAWDAVCYRGAALPECEGAPAQDTGGTGPSGAPQSIGRGFGIDTDRNDVDFIPQIEPSPWQPSYSEVW